MERIYGLWIDDIEKGKYYGKNIEDLRGVTIKSILHVKDPEDYLFFMCADQSVYAMFHEQDCCEEVYLETHVGKLKELCDVPIVFAHESVVRISSGDFYFYNIATQEGVTEIRWCGESGGYSTEVSFVKLNRKYEEVM